MTYHTVIEIIVLHMTTPEQNILVTWRSLSRNSDPLRSSIYH